MDSKMTSRLGLFKEVTRLLGDLKAELLCKWLIQNRCAETRGLVPLEMIARVVSWAIFEAAIQWSQEETTMSREQMANAILLVVMEGTAHLSPDALPE
jgi:hypothetical protein